MAERVVASPARLRDAIAVGRQTRTPWPGMIGDVEQARAAFLSGSSYAVPPLPDRGGELGDVLVRATTVDVAMGAFVDRLALLDLQGGSGLVSVSQLALDYAAGADTADPAAVAAAMADLERVLADKDLSAAERALAVRAVFDDLPPGVQISVGRAHPASIGNLDGVPPELRYAINRSRLTDHLADLDERIAAGADGERLIAQAAELRRLLETPYDHIVDVTGATVGQVRQVLFFDPSGDGRIGEVFGDIEAADNLATFVPGITNRLDNFKNTEDNAWNIYDNIGSPGTAVIAWLGYDTPEFLGAPGQLVADSWADDLADFHAATAALNSGASTTVVAHSYGSLLTGVALREEGLAPDRVIVIGSPGMGVRHISQLDLPPGTTLYAGRAQNDPVSLTSGHGADPATPWFGANVFNTDGISGHSSYTEPLSESLANISLIVTGDGSHITRDGLDWGDLADPFSDVLQYTLPVIGPISIGYEVVDGIVIGTRELIETANVVWDHTQDLAVELGHVLTNTLDRAWDTAGDIAEELGERATDLVGDVRDTVVSAGDRAVDLAGDAVDFLTPDIDFTPWN